MNTDGTLFLITKYLMNSSVLVFYRLFSGTAVGVPVAFVIILVAIVAAIALGVFCYLRYATFISYKKNLSMYLAIACKW